MRDCNPAKVRDGSFFTPDPEARARLDVRCSFDSSRHRDRVALTLGIIPENLTKRLMRKPFVWLLRLFS